MLYAQVMDAGISTDARIAKLITAALDGALTDAQAEQLAQVDRDLLKLAWLAAARRIAEQHQRIGELQAKLAGPAKLDPATPSGQRPIHTKPPARKRKAKPGARSGHPAAQAPRPARSGLA